MKKVVLFAIIAMSCMACETKNVSVKDSDSQILGRTIKTYEIEGCEYLGLGMGNEDGVLTHKGNCKNKIHIYNK